MSEEFNPEDCIDKRGDCEWEKRLSPAQNYRNLIEERKKPIPKIKLTKEDEKLIEEQKETAKDIERFMAKERLLRDYAKDYPIEDYSMLLYRLPLTDKQIEEVYNNLINN